MGRRPVGFYLHRFKVPAHSCSLIFIEVDHDLLKSHCGEVNHRFVARITVSFIAIGCHFGPAFIAWFGDGYFIVLHNVVNECIRTVCRFAMGGFLLPKVIRRTELW